MQDFKGKNVVITGGNRGIGKAIALAFAELSANVVITYNSDENAANVVINEIQKFGCKAKAIKANFLHDEDIQYLVKESYQFFNDIDILVNNVGILTRKPFLELSKEEVKKVFEVNFMTPLFLMQAFAHHMVKHQEIFTKNNGYPKDYCIVNITSLSRKVITPGLSHYESSKAALSQLSKAAAIDLSPHGIRVNDVAPGLIPTDINRNQWETNSSIWQKRIAGIPLHRAGMPLEIAKAVLSVAGNAFMTGTTLTVDGGRSRNWSGDEISENKQNNTVISKAKL